MVVDVPPESVSDFRDYEDRVLPLLQRYEGAVERRLATPDGTTEVHLLSFASETGYRGYLGDPERLDHRSRLDGVELVQRVVESLSDLP